MQIRNRMLVKISMWTRAGIRKQIRVSMLTKPSMRRSQYRRVIIATHRPVVDDGWSEDFKKIFFPGNSEHEYHYERKTKDSAYTFDEKTDAENDLKIRKLDKDGTYFVYFASVQDLRGSKIVGGKFNKNNAVFALDWDLIIIDEAHEGTQTELGQRCKGLCRSVGGTNAAEQRRGVRSAESWRQCADGGRKAGWFPMADRY